MSSIQPEASLRHPLALAEAVCARICHDLAGPLGALAGTLDMALAGDEEACSLAMELAALLSSRLTLLRMAWSGGEAPPGLDAGMLLPGLPGADRLRVEAAGLAADQPDRLRRMVPSLLLVAASCLPRGGTISLSGGPGQLVVGIEGAGAAWPEALAECAASPDLCLAAPGGARGIAVPVACLGAHRLGLKLAMPTPMVMHVIAA